MAITGTNEGTSRERMRLKSLTDRCWIRKLVLFYKIVNGLSPQYLCRYVNFNDSPTCITRSSNLNKVIGICSRTE